MINISFFYQSSKRFDHSPNMGRLAEISPRKHEHVTWQTISIAITIHFADGKQWKHAMLQAIRLPVSLLAFLISNQCSSHKLQAPKGISSDHQPRVPKTFHERFHLNLPNAGLPLHVQVDKGMEWRVFPTYNARTVCMYNARTLW